jgi:hypothetical protein
MYGLVSNFVPKFFCIGAFFLDLIFCNLRFNSFVDELPEV